MEKDILYYETGNLSISLEYYLPNRIYESIDVFMQHIAIENEIQVHSTGKVTAHYVFPTLAKFIFALSAIEQVNRAANGIPVS